MSRAKSLYHALVPPAVRYPIGRVRRGFLDRLRRLVTGGPLPPRRLLTRVQMTPWIGEYVEIGEQAAAAVGEALSGRTGGVSGPAGGWRVLDFGCGLGRVLRHFGERAAAGGGWELHGCDVDVATLEWSRRAFPFARFAASGTEPPLPYPDARFDAVYAVSVFTHFDADGQRRWAAELARVLASGGLAVITAMGPRAFASFPRLASVENRRRLEEEGFFFYPGVTPDSGEDGESSGAAFNVRGAFHTGAGLERFFAAGFELERWTEGGLDGFQDLAVFRRRSDLRPADPG